MPVPQIIIVILEVQGYIHLICLLSYDRKQTTCKPEDLTITLPNIALSELYNTGKVSNKNAADNIRLQCDNLFGNAKQTIA